MKLRFGQIFYDTEKKIKVKVIGNEFPNKETKVEFDLESRVRVVNLTDLFRDGYSTVKNLRKLTDKKDFLYEQKDEET